MKRTTLTLSVKDLLAASKADSYNTESLLFDGDSTDVFSNFVSDSRKTKERSLFLCIPGQKVDGHDFIEQAVAAKVSGIIGSDREKIESAAKKFPNTPFFVVKDCLLATQAIATAYRRKFAIPTVGLTGSSGKTTTKDLMASIFNREVETALITEGTLNNHWGVPQMALRLNETHRASVFEMGISGFGELLPLCQIARPTIGYITTIGSSHLEKLRSEEGVLKEKRVLFDWIFENSESRALVFNLDNAHLENLHREFLAKGGNNLRLLTISQKKNTADVRIESCRSLGVEHRFGWEYHASSPWGAIKGILPLAGAHNLSNAMAAAALTLASGEVTIEEVVKGLAEPQLTAMRSNLFRHESGAVIFDDSYNANPASVSALFEAARVIRTTSQSGLTKTVAVVGDMLELGEKSSALHQLMGKRAAQNGIDVLLATGQFAQDWALGFTSEKHGVAMTFGTHDEVFSALQDILKASPTQTLVLVKGSRGAKMDLVVKRLQPATPQNKLFL